jgi:hypothetical protein
MTYNRPTLPPPMKVFNLSCEHDHRFEGWFGSAGDFDVQLQDGLLECPVCGSRDIRKLPSAPRLNLSGAGAAPASAQPSAGEAPAVPAQAQLQDMMKRVARFLMQNTEDVGDRFAEEARRIHYRESPERGIRGIATRDEASELREEGIDVFSLPIPVRTKEPLQ